MQARLVGPALLVVLLPLLVGTGGPARAVTSTAVPSGLDAASYQHPGGAAIDWGRVRDSGRRLTFVKATEGLTYRNPWFAGDWRGAATAGLFRGAYHYARPTPQPGSATSQAQAFSKAVGTMQVPGVLPPVLDLEETGGLTPVQLAGWVQEFLQAVQAATGRTPMIYTYPSFWHVQMADSGAFHAYPLWIASYGTSAPPTLGWPRWTFWQTTSGGSVDGVPGAGSTDLDVFNGTDLDLAALAQAGSWGSATSTVDRAGSDRWSDVPGSTGSRYVPVQAERFLDTRSRLGGVSGPVRGTVTATVPASVPADAVAVVLDVSAVGPRGPGYLRVSPAGTAPSTTAVNYPARHGVTGLVVTALDPERRVDLTSSGGATDLTGDLVGYYTQSAGAGGHWTPTDAVRVVDTRSGLGAPSGATTGDVHVTLPATVPADATGVVLDVTAVDPTGDGYLRVTPAGVPAATTAMNFSAGSSTTALALTATTAGRLTVSIAGSPAQLVVDLVGWYEGAAAGGSGFVPLPPQRFVDTRGGLAARGPGSGPLLLTVPVQVPADATAVLLDVSLVDPDGTGYVRLAAPGSVAGTTAVNTAPRLSRTGLVMTGVRDGQVTLAVYGTNTHLVVDLLGYQSVVP